MPTYKGKMYAWTDQHSIHLNSQVYNASLILVSTRPGVYLYVKLLVIIRCPGLRVLT